MYLDIDANTLQNYPDTETDTFDCTDFHSKRAKVKVSRYFLDMDTFLPSFSLRSNLGDVKQMLTKH